MLQHEIQKRLEDEISGIETSAHNWLFRPFLLTTPEVCEFKYLNGLTSEVWVVLRENPNGYCIIFDSEENEYGLATSNVIISNYPTFMEALNAM